jgi:hypothetical protein
MPRKSGASLAVAGSVPSLVEPPLGVDVEPDPAAESFAAGAAEDCDGSMLPSLGGDDGGVGESPWTVGGAVEGSVLPVSLWAKAVPTSAITIMTKSSGEACLITRLLFSGGVRGDS